MTDRLKGVTVTFTQDIRDDDAQQILKAIEMIRGVAHVEPSLVTPEDHMNRQVIKSEWRNKIYEFITKELQ